MRNPEIWVPFVAKPTLVQLPQRVKFVECGGHHTMVITLENQVFGCGLNTSGQLGISNKKQDMLSLTIVTQKSQNRANSTLKNRKELTDIANTQEDFGTDLFPVMTHVPVASGFGFSQIACGDDFTLLLTTNGNVLSTGGGASG